MTKENIIAILAFCIYLWAHKYWPRRRPPNLQFAPGGHGGHGGHRSHGLRTQLSNRRSQRFDSNWTVGKDSVFDRNHKTGLPKPYPNRAEADKEQNRFEEEQQEQVYFFC